jgi:hypothetical protein
MYIPMAINTLLHWAFKLNSALTTAEKLAFKRQYDKGQHKRAGCQTNI